MVFLVQPTQVVEGAESLEEEVLAMAATVALAL
jgi:hypothetical protein